MLFYPNREPYVERRHRPRMPYSLYRGTFEVWADTLQELAEVYALITMNGESGPFIYKRIGTTEDHIPIWEELPYDGKFRALVRAEQDRLYGR